MTCAHCRFACQRYAPADTASPTDAIALKKWTRACCPRNTRKDEMEVWIDVMQIERADGAFPCPKCGALLDPEDETEDKYKRVGAGFEGDDLAEILLVCVNCKQAIRLYNFPEDLEDEKRARLAPTFICCIRSKCAL